MLGGGRAVGGGGDNGGSTRQLALIERKNVSTAPRAAPSAASLVQKFMVATRGTVSCAGSGGQHWMPQQQQGVW